MIISIHTLIRNIVVFESGQTRLDGVVEFLDQSDPMQSNQPAIYIEPEGHGVKAGGSDVRRPGYSSQE